MPLGVVLLAIVWTFVHSTPLPLDDHFLYQAFIEKLAVGRIDLTIPGFHGSDILAVPFYWVTGSSVAQIYFQIFCAVLLPVLAYLAAESIYKDAWLATVFAMVIALMPFLSFVALRGWTGPAFHCLLFATIIAAMHRSRFTGVLFALAILTKPFALALLPLLICNAPPRRGKWKRYTDVYIAFGLVAIYLIVQLTQAGEIIVGAHQGLNQSNVWQGPSRVFLNAAHALQIIFSVHNYYFPDPSLTGAGNMMHTTPVLIFLGLWGLLQKQYINNEKIRCALMNGVIIGLGLNMLLDRMDHFYMEAGLLMVILAALPVLKSHKIWIPIVLATLHFQWLYFYLQFGEAFQLDFAFFSVPVVIDMFFLAWCAIHSNDVRKELSAVF